jgi:hypothetical protein
MLHLMNYHSSIDSIYVAMEKSGSFLIRQLTHLRKWLHWLHTSLVMALERCTSTRSGVTQLK